MIELTLAYVGIGLCAAVVMYIILDDEETAITNGVLWPLATLVWVMIGLFRGIDKIKEPSE